MSPLADDSMGIRFRHPGGLRIGGDGALYRFGDGRYLLATEYWGAESTQFRVGLFILELLSGGPTLSPPWDLGPDENASLVRAIADVDGDGLLDVVVCRWPVGTYLQDEPGFAEEPPRPGTPELLGYRDGGWHELHEGSWTGECPVL